MTSVPCCTMNLRSRAIATVSDASMRVEADDAMQATPELCVVCQDELNNSSDNATLPCGHCFHSTCIISHLRYDGRCPTCRDNPAFPDNDSYIFDDDDFEDIGPTISQAIEIARVAAKTNPRVKQSFVTLRKWKQEATDARKMIREANKKLRPLEDKFKMKIEKYTKKMWKKFDRKNKCLVEAVDNGRKRLIKARGFACSTEYRIAKKHGYVRRRYRSMRSHGNAMTEADNV